MIQLVRRGPPTTYRTGLKTACSLTSELLEPLAATAADDGDSVGMMSVDDEPGVVCCSIVVWALCCSNSWMCVDDEPGVVCCSIVACALCCSNSWICVFIMTW